MAEKISTIILKVDLECRRCYKKISKTISKLQERESIQTVAFDDKNNTVAISGPFNPKKLIKKLCCKAGNLIKDIQIKETKEKEKPKDEEPKEGKPKKDKPKDTKDPGSKPDKPKEDKPKLLEPDPPATKPVTVEPGFVVQEPESGYRPVWLGPGFGCSCRPWYEGYYGDYKCPWCGRGCGWVSAGPPAVVYGSPYGGYKTCRFIYEEEPQSSCSIM